MSTQERNTRRTITGEVTSRSGDKSIKVTVFYKKPHPLYGKEIKRKTVLHVHDANNEASIGDTVLIMETRPISKIKRFRVVEILSKSKSLDS